MAVFLLWWALVGALFLAAVRSASSQQPTDCPGFCVSDAGGLALMGIFVVWPGMLVSLLVAAIVLAARSRETRSPGLLGTRTAACIAAGALLITALMLTT
jgi:hypothetical protein